MDLPWGALFWKSLSEPGFNLATGNSEGLVDHSPMIPMGKGHCHRGLRNLRRRRYRKRPATD